MPRKTQVLGFDPARVKPLPGQPRQRFRGIKELADSIAEVGQTTPGIVTLVEGDAKFDAQLVDGERRLRACLMAGVPFRAEVREPMDEEETFVASFAANFGKQDHDVLEVAHGLARMQKAGKTIEQLGRIAGRSLCWVNQHLSLLKLHPDVQAMMVCDGEDDTPRLTFSLAQLLVPVAADQQLALARKIVGKKPGEGMSMARARRFILRERAKSGDDGAYGGGQTRNRSITTIESILADFTDRLGVYIDMPGSDFRRLVEAIDNRRKRLLAESLRDTAESCEMLAETVEKALPRLGTHGRLGPAVGIGAGAA